MNAEDFLKLVLPSEGNKIIALAVPGENGRTWFRYRKYSSATAAAHAAEQFDAQGQTVYFAVNGFGDWYHDEKKDRKRIRTQENVVACRSLYDDFDVDPDKDGAYDTREEALADVVKFANALRLHVTITSSGGGFHCYTSFDEDVDAAVWEELAALKRDITAHLKLKVDRAVDMDVSRILRPVGTHNRKTDNPRPVRVLKQGKQYPVEVVREKFHAFIKENKVAPAPTQRTGGGVAANPFPQRSANTRLQTLSA